MRGCSKQPHCAASTARRAKAIRLSGMALMAMAFVVASSSGSAQTTSPLTLPQAVSMALEKNPMHKAAMADVQIGIAAIRQARAPLMPKITFTESAVRGKLKLTQGWRLAIFGQAGSAAVVG